MENKSAHSDFEWLIRERDEAEKRVEELEIVLARKNKIILLLALGDRPDETDMANGGRKITINYNE